MGIEIDTMNIENAVQARALSAQGFISEDELQQKLEQLPTDNIDLNRLAVLNDENRGVPLWRIVLREIGFTKPD